MKKLLVILFSAISLLGYAQKFQLINSDENPYTDGETVSIIITESDFERTGEFIFTIPIKNLIATDLTIHTLRTNLNLIEGMEALVCLWQCYDPDDYEINHEFQGMESETYQLHLRSDACYCYFGLNKFKLEFWTEMNQSDKVTLNVNIDMQPLGVKDNNNNVLLSAFPNPISVHAKLNVSYTLADRNEEQKLVIRNIMGSVVKSMSLNPYDNMIAVDVSDFKPGVYFYAIENKKYISIAKKLIVK